MISLGFHCCLLVITCSTTHGSLNSRDGVVSFFEYLIICDRVGVYLPYRVAKIMIRVVVKFITIIVKNVVQGIQLSKIVVKFYWYWFFERLS